MQAKGLLRIHAGEAMNEPFRKKASLSQGCSCGLESKVKEEQAGFP